MKRFAILSLALLAACAAPLGSDRNPVGNQVLLAYAPEGTRITLENKVNGEVSRTNITAAKASGPRGAYTDANGKSGGFYPGCWGCGGSMTIDEEAYRTLWPLEKGKRVVFLRTAPDGQRARIVITVAGSERITTPAGSFDTYILDGRLENIGGPTYSAQVRAWWAPGRGWVVRAKGGDSSGNSLSSEVVEFIYP